MSKRHNFKRIDSDEDEDHVYLLGPGFDFAIIVPTYDLLKRSEAERILRRAGIDPVDYRHLL